MTRDELDGFDLAILRVLKQDGRISITDLAKEISLSKSPTQARLKRLERAGFITGYQALVDNQRLGLGHVVFVEVKLQDTRESALNAFNAAVRATPEIEECHLIAGAFDYLLKVRSADIQNLSADPGRAHLAPAACRLDLDPCGDGGGQGEGGR